MRRILTYLDPLLECKVALCVFLFQRTRIRKQFSRQAWRSLHPWHRKSSGCPRKWWKRKEVFARFLEAVDRMKQGWHTWNETAKKVQVGQCEGGI